MIDKNLINEDYSFTITNDDGLEVICDTLALIESEDNPIVIYTDYTLDQNNKFNIFVSQLVSNGDSFSLQTIDNYQNIPEIKKALDQIWENL